MRGGEALARIKKYNIYIYLWRPKKMYKLPERGGGGGGGRGNSGNARKKTFIFSRGVPLFLKTGWYDREFKTGACLPLSLVITLTMLALGSPLTNTDRPTWRRQYGWNGGIIDAPGFKGWDGWIQVKMVSGKGKRWTVSHTGAGPGVGWEWGGAREGAAVEDHGATSSDMTQSVRDKQTKVVKYKGLVGWWVYVFQCNSV